MAEEAILAMETTTSAPAPADLHSTELSLALREWVEGCSAPGATMAVRFRDGSIWTGAAGWADTGSRRLLAPEDTFRIGSVTKLATAVVVLQLADEGGLDLDGPVSTLDPRLDERITFRHLLTHQSGLSRYGYDLGVWVPLEEGGPTLSELVDGAIEAGLDFAPGTNHRYSNTNYAVLGQLLETITGLPYPLLLQERIIEPLELGATFVAGAEPGQPTAAPEGVGAGVEPDVAARSGAAGSLVSSAGDLTRLLHGVFGAGALPAALLGEATTSVAFPNGNSAHYGMGVEVLSIDGSLAWGHTGGVHGYRAAAFWFPDTELAVAALVNTLRRSCNPVEAVGAAHALVVSP